MVYNLSMSKKNDGMFPGQHEGEVVELLVRQHPVVMRKTLIFGLLVILIAVVPLDFPIVYASDFWAGVCVKIALGVPVLVFAFWFYRWIGWYYTMYIVTDRRILEVHQSGFFKRRVGEWQLESIQNVNYEIDGFQAVIFGFGDITAKTYIGDLTLEKVHKPAEVHEHIVAAVKRAGGGSAQFRGGSTQLRN
jgi:hypothetical protein